MTGTWSHYSSYTTPVHCGINGVVYFHWYANWHNLIRMASAAHYDTCDFTGSTTIVPLGTTDETAQYYLPCSTPGETLYLSCSVGTHCVQGQKVTVSALRQLARARSLPAQRVARRGGGVAFSPQVHVSSTQYAVDPSGATVIHVKSLARVMSLLGSRTDASTGFSYLDRGYQAESLATTTLEVRRRPPPSR